jgi:hypothetical protein
MQYPTQPPTVLGQVEISVHVLQTGPNLSLQNE